MLLGPTFFLSLACALHAAAGARPKVKYFRTEPKHDPISWDIRILTKDRARLSPGYYFFSPGIRGHHWGPKIYDVDGTLILDGDLDGFTSHGVAEWRVCDWKGSTGIHVCAHDGSNGNRVFDSTYTQVGFNYTDTGPIKGVSPGTHEFNMLPGGKSLLQPVNQRRRMDLQPFGGVKEGFAKCNCFQEVDVYTGKVFYTYESFDHLDPTETYIFPDVPGRKNLTSGIAGDGRSAAHAWDWMHMNSVDKNKEGDYLVSARHMDSVIKVAGPNNIHGLAPGTTIWKLGGKRSDFKMDFKFSRQHHVRYLSSGPNGDVLSLFDNAWEGWDDNPPSAKASAGMVIEANNQTMIATLLHRYDHPEGILSGSRGGFNQLPDGNAVAGWGHKVPQITEWAANGDVLFHVEYTYPWCAPPHGCGPKSEGDVAFSYRSHKAPWVATPYWNPKLLAYSQTCNPSKSALVAYVSWNGATEVKKWKFYTGSSLSGPWIDAGVYAKNGFETQATLPRTASFQPFVRVDAINADGETIGTVDGPTFVPNQNTVNHCNNVGCADQFKYLPHFSIANTCPLQAPDAAQPETVSDASSDTRPNSSWSSWDDHSISWVLPCGFILVWIIAVLAELMRSTHRRYVAYAEGTYEMVNDVAGKADGIDERMSRESDHDGKEYAQGYRTTVKGQTYKDTDDSLERSFHRV